MRSLNLKQVSVQNRARDVVGKTDEVDILTPKPEPLVNLAGGVAAVASKLGGGGPHVAARRLIFVERVDRRDTGSTRRTSSADDCVNLDEYDGDSPDECETATAAGPLVIGNLHVYPWRTRLDPWRRTSATSWPCGWLMAPRAPMIWPKAVADGE